MTTTPTDLLARLRAVLTAAEGFAGEFRFIPAWEADNGGPLVANRVDFPDSVYFIPDGAEFDPRYPTDDGCVLITDSLEEHAARPLVTILNATADLAALLALVEAPAGVEPTCACGSRLVGGVPGDAARFGWVCYECRLAKVELADGTPLTVGAALADPRVQDGSHVVGVRGLVDPGPNFYMQFRVDRYVQSRMLLGQVAWMTWGVHSIVNGADLALPCRLVPLADADRDPTTRGTL